MRRYAERRSCRTEFRIMSELEKRGPMTPTELARRIDERYRQKLSMSLRYLREQMIIATLDDETDGRRKKYYLTPYGRLVLSVLRDFVGEVQASSYTPIERITPQDILRFTSSERTRNRALPILGKWIEDSKLSLRKLNQKLSEDADPFRYTPMNNVCDDGFFKYAIAEKLKLDPAKCIHHSTSIDGINLILNKHQDAMSTALRTIEEIIDQPEIMNDLTLLGIFGPSVEVYYFELPSASEKDPINCPRGTAVRKRFAEELSQDVCSESWDDLELCARYIQGEYTRIVSIIDSKAWLQIAGKKPQLGKTYDRMVLINRSKAESRDPSVKKLIKQKESIHNCLYAEEWRYKVALNYAKTKLPSTIEKMLHGYCKDSA
jgi:DNA-binding MarR family transcriptional regulator